MADHYRNHRSLVEKNVHKVFILPSRWQDGFELNFLTEDKNVRNGFQMISLIKR